MAVPESTTETAFNAGGGIMKPDPFSNGGSVTNKKNTRESDRRRRRRKQKKIKPPASDGEKVEARGVDDDHYDDDKENSDPHYEVDVSVEIEYVPEKVNLEDTLVEEFKNVFEKFSFSDSAAGEDTDKKDELAANSESKKKDSDSEDEPDTLQKEKGLSNKKKKLQRRMKIAELKQICTRPDVVEVWDATASDPKLLVYLKSYRNTVPVPRHWCQKRKFLQETSCNSHGART